MENPYHSPQVYQTDDPEYEYAGFWLRAKATVIDALLLACVSMPLVMMADVFGNVPEYTLDVVANVLYAILYVYFWVRYAGTVGHRLLGLKIVDEATGKHLTVSQAVLRYLGYFLSVACLGLGLIWVIFDKKKQGWHDKMAKTVVVREL